MKVNKLNVFIRFSESEDLIGQLVLDNSEILFKYSESYLEKGSNISPLKLNFDSSVQTAEVNPFKGLFGVFADSLPDAWGDLLMRRHLSKKEIPVETLSVLDQLAFVGSNGLGALVYRPSNTEIELEANEIDLELINTNVIEVLKGESSEIIDLIFEKGGSPGGARPKIYAGYNKANDSLIYGSSVLKDGYEHWIIKFAGGIDFGDIANIEMAYYSMALDAGLKMSESKLFSGKSGKQYFGTKRFDRIGNNRLHMISSAGLLHDDFERSQLDYGILMQEGEALIESAQAFEQILHQAAFNVFAHNRDDHSKNFAFLMDERGKWQLAPAYDLTFSSSSQSHHSTACAGNTINPGSKELYELADHFSVSCGKEIIEKLKDTISKWDKYAEQAGVSKVSSNAIGKTIRSILKKL